MQRSIKTHTTIVAITLALCLVGMVTTSTAFAQECVNNEDGTLTDTKNNGMVWRYSGDGYTWENCMQTVSNLQIAGYSDWRVPSNDDYYVFFSTTCRNDNPLNNLRWSWSSTTDPHNEKYAYTIHFQQGGGMPTERKNESYACIGIRMFN